jgi:hypothetical protein
VQIAARAYRSVASLRDFVRGYRFATTASDGETMPSGERPRAVSDLERHFDSHATGPGIFKWRHYFDIYDRHLSHLRGTDVHLLEIGVAGGGSLAMWREYFGPSAYICGMDIDPDCGRFADERTEIVVGDQADESFWRRFIASHNPLDIVIDDGGHLPEQQIVTLEHLLPHIKPGGVYVCEDIHGAFQPFHAFIDGLARPLHDVPIGLDVKQAANALQRAVASVHRYPLVCVIEKASATAPMFVAERRGSKWPSSWAELPNAIPPEPTPNSA